jgi:hypothetical protein
LAKGFSRCYKIASPKKYQAKKCSNHLTIILISHTRKTVGMYIAKDRKVKRFGYRRLVRILEKCSMMLRKRFVYASQIGKRLLTVMIELLEILKNNGVNWRQHD